MLSFSCSGHALSTSCMLVPEHILSGPPGPMGEVLLGPPGIDEEAEAQRSRVMAGL